MTVRGPTGPKPTETRSPVDKSVQNLARALLDAGIAKSPAEAMKLARALLQAVAGKVVPNASLGDVIKLFQKDAGLKETGSLDKETLAALVDAGLVEPGEIEGEHAPSSTDGAGGAATTPGAQKRPADGVDKSVRAWGKVTGEPARSNAPSSSSSSSPGEAKHAVAIEGAKERAELAKPKSLGEDLKTLTSTLGQLGFAGKGQGAERLRAQVKDAQKTLGLPVTGRLDEKTREAIARYAENPASSTRDARREGGARSPTGVERRAGGEDAARTEGRGKASDDDGVAQQTGARATEANATAAHGEASVDEGNRSGLEGDDGNAPAGDEDREGARRGHATLDDGGDHERGFYEVAPLSRQIADAFELVARDDDGKGPPTYAWDVTFYKPGVYGAGQPAEPLWHIGLAHTSPFDDVWGEAARVLGERLLALEPEARAPAREDFERALRRARYRDS